MYLKLMCVDLINWVELARIEITGVPSPLTWQWTIGYICYKVIIIIIIIIIIMVIITLLSYDEILALEITFW